MIKLVNSNDLEELEKDGLEELREKSLEYKRLVNEVFVAVNGCSNTINLARSLQVIDTVLVKLLIDIMSLI